MEALKSLGNFFLKGHVESSDWWAHVKGYYINSKNMNTLFLKYEDMHKYPDLAVKRINDYCSLPNLSDSQTQHVVKETTFKRMKSSTETDCSWLNGHRHPTATPFLRKGVVGNWREHFSEELSVQFDEKTQSYFAETDLEFDYLL